MHSFFATRWQLLVILGICLFLVDVPLSAQDESQKTLPADGRTVEPPFLGRMQIGGFDVKYLQYSPDGQSLVSGSSDGAVELWNVMAMRRTNSLCGTSGENAPAAISPDGKLITFADQTALHLWDTEQQNLVAEQNLQFTMTDLRFTPDGKTVVVVQPAKVSLWNVSTKKEGAVIDRGFGQSRAAVSPDGKLLAVANNHAKKVKVWNFKTKKLQFSVAAKGHIYDVCFSPDSEYLAIGCEAMILWDIEAKKVFMERKLQGDITAVSFSPDGQAFAVGTKFGGVFVTSLKKLSGIVFRHDGKMIGSLAFSPDNKTLASGGYDHHINFWDVSHFTGRVEE